jgi:hypothetical protein
MERTMNTQGWYYISKVFNFWSAKAFSPNSDVPKKLNNMSN